MRSFHRKLVGRRRISFFLSFFRLLIRMNTRTREAPPPARGSKNEGKRQKPRQFSASPRSYFPRSLSLPFSRSRDGPSVVVKLWFVGFLINLFVCFPVLFLVCFLSFHWRQTFLQHSFLSFHWRRISKAKKQQQQTTNNRREDEVIHFHKITFSIERTEEEEF